MEGWRGTPTGGGDETPEPGFFGIEALSPEETSRPSRRPDFRDVRAF